MTQHQQDQQYEAFEWRSGVTSAFILIGDKWSFYFDFDAKAVRGQSVPGINPPQSELKQLLEGNKPTISKDEQTGVTTITLVEAHRNTPLVITVDFDARRITYSGETNISITKNGSHSVIFTFNEFVTLLHKQVGGLALQFMRDADQTNGFPLYSDPQSTDRDRLLSSNQYLQPDPLIQKIDYSVHSMHDRKGGIHIDGSDPLKPLKRTKKSYED